LVLSACGGSDSDDSGSSDDEPAATTSDGTIDDVPPSGQATASVDGLDFAFDLPGGLACSISDEALTYSYRIGDNEVTLGAGMNRVDGGWMGSIAMSIANPTGEQGPVGYYPAPGDLGVLDESLIIVDGDTAMYEGPMLKQPANDGSLPPPVDVGTGTVIATC
ncbi:MAG: hypothetical protein ACR2NL_08445, partial [Acidimicrobiia bacterium]